MTTRKPLVILDNGKTGRLPDGDTIAGVPESSLERALLTISTNGQTVFTLPSTPAAPGNSLLFLNGIKQAYGVDYVIDGLILTWSSIALLTSDTLEIFY